MAVFRVTGSANGTITGTAGNDIYIVDPENLGSTVIRDLGGNDTIRVYDRPGRTAGELIIATSELIWRTFEGDEVRFRLGANDRGMIERFEWDDTPGDGTSYSLRSTIVIGSEGVTQAKVAVAGTAGADVIRAPDLPRPVGSWSEIYGNAGNDRLTASDDHLYVLYGGRGDDTLLGRGTFADEMVGDAGNDTVRGAGGSDFLEGGRGADAVYGGSGKDNLRGNEGSDRLSGGAGADSFAFKPGFQVDRIVDFERGQGDVLLFEGGITQSDLRVQQRGDDVHIFYGADGHIIVDDTLRAQLRFDFD